MNVMILVMIMGITAKKIKWTFAIMVAIILLGSVILSAFVEAQYFPINNIGKNINKDKPKDNVKKTITTVKKTITKPKVVVSPITPPSITPPSKELDPTQWNLDPDRNKWVIKNDNDGKGTYTLDKNGGKVYLGTNSNNQQIFSNDPFPPPASKDTNPADFGLPTDYTSSLTPYEESGTGLKYYTNSNEEKIYVGANDKGEVTFSKTPYYVTTTLTNGNLIFKYSKTPFTMTKETAKDLSKSGRTFIPLMLKGLGWVEMGENARADFAYWYCPKACFDADGKLKNDDAIKQYDKFKADNKDRRLGKITTSVGQALEMLVFDYLWSAVTGWIDPAIIGAKDACKAITTSQIYNSPYNQGFYSNTMWTRMPDTDLQTIYANMNANSVSLNGEASQISDDNYLYLVTVKIFPTVDSTWKIWLKNTCSGENGINIPDYVIADNLAIQSFVINRHFYSGGKTGPLKDGVDCPGGQNSCRFNQVCVQALTGSDFNNKEEYCYPITTTTSYYSALSSSDKTC